jgi:hypothetical protein
VCILRWNEAPPFFEYAHGGDEDLYIIQADAGRGPHNPLRIIITDRLTDNDNVAPPSQKVQERKFSRSTGPRRSLAHGRSGPARPDSSPCPRRRARCFRRRIEIRLECTGAAILGRCFSRSLRSSAVSLLRGGG